MHAAKLLGIVVSEASASDTVELLSQLEGTLSGGKGAEAPKRFEERCGSLSATGLVLAQCATGKALSADTIVASSNNFFYMLCQAAA